MISDDNRMSMSEYESESMLEIKDRDDSDKKTINHSTYPSLEQYPNIALLAPQKGVFFILLSMKPFFTLYAGNRVEVMLVFLYSHRA